MKAPGPAFERDQVRSAFVVGLILIAILLNIISLTTASWVTSYHVYDGVGNYRLAQHRVGAFDLCLKFTNYDMGDLDEICYSLHSESTIKNVVTGVETQASMCDYGRDVAAFEALGLAESRRMLALVSSVCGGSGTTVIALQIASMVLAVATLAVFITGWSGCSSFDQYKPYEVATIGGVGGMATVLFALVAMWNAGVDHAGGAGVSATLVAFSLLMLLFVAVNIRACIIQESTESSDRDVAALG